MIKAPFRSGELEEQSSVVDWLLDSKNAPNNCNAIELARINEVEVRANRPEMIRCLAMLRTCQSGIDQADR